MQAKKMADLVVEMFIWLKLVENLQEMEVRRFARIKKVIWDQLLATRAEIIQGKLYFHFACTFSEVTIRVSDYILCRASMNITVV